MTTQTPDENEVYHADTRRIGKSGLDLIAKSPAHYWAKYLDPNRVRDEEKSYFVVGSVAHAAVLENKFLENKYFILDDTHTCAAIGGTNPRATNRYKEWKALQLQLNKGKTEISIQDWNAVLGMRQAVWNNRVASVLLEGGVAEQRIDFTHPENNVLCKAKPDWISDNGWIVDLKTTEDASPTGFAKSVWNYRYHVQAAFYFDAYKAAYGEEPKGFIFIAVEKSAPYLTATYWITPSLDLFHLGRRTYMHDLEVYRQCLMRDEWPGYSEEIQPLSIPAWAVRQSQYENK